jgi:hypothetical protein
MLPPAPNGQVQAPQPPPNGNLVDNQRTGVVQTNGNGNANANGVDGNEEDDDDDDDHGMTDDAE